MKKDLFKGLTPEQIEKAKACENVSDLIQLAKDEDVTLTDEQLDAVNGGGCSASTKKNRRKLES